jgi:hypothetical protein
MRIDTNDTRDDAELSPRVISTGHAPVPPFEHHEQTASSKVTFSAQLCLTIDGKRLSGASTTASGDNATDRCVCAVTHILIVRRQVIAGYYQKTTGPPKAANGVVRE